MVPEVFYYHHGLKYCEKNVLDYICNKIFIDCGAFWGDSSVIFNEYHPKEVFAFELIGTAENKYYDNLKLNTVDINKFHFMNMGISDTQNIIEIDNHDLMANLSNVHESGTKIDVDTLDHLFLTDSNGGGYWFDKNGYRRRRIRHCSWSRQYYQTG